MLIRERHQLANQRRDGHRKAVSGSIEQDLLTPYSIAACDPLNETLQHINGLSISREERP
jgi:hypothetical protein